jgi:hypothetical protein
MNFYRAQGALVRGQPLADHILLFMSMMKVRNDNVHSL